MKTIIALCAVFALAACSNSSSSNPGGSNTPQAGGNVPAALQGTWHKACRNTGSSTYAVESIILADTTVTSQTEVYLGDATCGSNQFIRARVEAGVAIGSASTIAAGASDVDLVANHTWLTYTNSVAVSSANSSSFCGFTDWQLNVEKEVTGLVCAGEQQMAAGTRHYDLFKFENNMLYVGLKDAAHDGTAPEKRPVQVDPAGYSK
jgi:hypothetical protein